MRCCGARPVSLVSCYCTIFVFTCVFYCLRTHLANKIYIFFPEQDSVKSFATLLLPEHPNHFSIFRFFWGWGWGADTLCPYKAHVSPTPIILRVKERSCTEHLPVQTTDVRFSVNIHQMARSDCNSNERSFHLANASENNSRDYASFWLDSWPTPYVLCLRRHQARLAGGGIMLSTCAFVRLFVRSSINKLVNTIVDKIINRFWYKLAHVVRGEGHEASNFGDQEVKGRDRVAQK